MKGKICVFLDEKRAALPLNAEDQRHVDNRDCKDFRSLLNSSDSDVLVPSISSEETTNILRLFIAMSKKNPLLCFISNHTLLQIRGHMIRQEG